MPALVRIVFAFSALGLVRFVDGGRHLRAKAVQTQDAERAMLAKLAHSFRKTDGSSRVEAFEAALRPMYAALPKDRHGALSHRVVRYALHRLFMDRRSWYIRGLDPNSDTLNQTAQFAKLQVGTIPMLPTLLQQTLEHAHDGVGLSLRETATLAAALEDLVHRENMGRLSMAYEVLGMDQNVSQDPSETVTAYMTIYLLANNFSKWTTDEVQGKMRDLLRSRRWAGLKPWVHKVQSHALGMDGASQPPELTHKDTVQVVEALGEAFGSFNDQECRAMKHTLLQMESRMPGRVRLSDFYNKSRFGVWGFTEKRQYLRDLGALDESNASNPQVIVTNYVTSIPQCLQASGIYLTCCRNECEGLMSTIETVVAGPEADPQHIVGIVSNLNSDTVQAPRELSETLSGRLQNIADHHGGRVPIHGRLFALWIHNAFPRECPYPHQAGSTSPQTPDEWMKETGQRDSQATDDEMLEHIRPDDSCSANDADAESALPWGFSEELLVSHNVDLPLSPSPRPAGAEVMATHATQMCFMFMPPMLAVALYFSSLGRELVRTFWGTPDAKARPVLCF